MKSIPAIGQVIKITGNPNQLLVVRSRELDGYESITTILLSSALSRCPNPKHKLFHFGRQQEIKNSTFMKYEDMTLIGTPLLKIRSEIVYYVTTTG